MRVALYAGRRKKETQRVRDGLWIGFAALRRTGEYVGQRPQ